MGRFKALLFASVVAVGGAQSARAADLLPPPPPLEAPPLRGPVVEETGFYLRGDVGLGVNDVSSVHSSFAPGAVVPGAQIDQSSLGDSTFVDFGVGYQFNNWFRADLTGEYRGSAAYTAVASYDSSQWGGTCGNVPGGSFRCSDLYSGNISSAVFLANAYLDMGTWYGVTPFIGGGIGVAGVKVGSLTDRSVGNTGGGYSTTTTTTNFAWAAMAGLAYAVTPNVKLEIGYRYLDLGNVASGGIVCQPVGVAGCPLEVQHMHIASNDVRLGFRYLLAAPAYVEPVRARY